MEKPIYILGISCYYHDASAALLKDGVVVAAAQEERFTRKKHDPSFPVHAIQFCLSSERIDINAIQYIGFYEKPLLKFERVLSQHLEMFPWSLKTFVTSMPSWIGEKLWVIRTIRKKLKYKGGVLFIEHHMAHAASAFLISPFARAALVTADGVGEWTTTTYGIGEGNDIRLLQEIKFPHSLGLLYSAITAYLGFSVNNSEYKVMGLAASGSMDRSANPYYSKFKEIIDVKDDGSFRLNMEYFTYHYADHMLSRKLCEFLGGPVRMPEQEISDRHKDIAAALQLIFEDVQIKILQHVYRATGCENLVIAGGCGLNSSFNGKIIRNTSFKRVWTQPDPGDGGTSIGAASYIYHTLLGNKRNFILETAYLGPEYSDQEIKIFLSENKIKYSQFQDEAALIKEAAKLICGNKVVGWFQGRMEWGPRALGARSILANPGNPEAKEILNAKVKHREKFRPFAPAVCLEDVEKYFACDSPLPAATDFMLMVYPIKPEWREKIPSVTHVDGSGRLQTVKRGQNFRYHDVIKAVGAGSGIPIIINTSFNIRGEPIVCSPYDAYKCMMGTGIDCLIMGSFLIKREDNLIHEWDSEKYAKD